MASQEHVIVVGAGISGLAAAVLLVRDHGMRVTVYERALDLSQADEESYPIGANPRGMHVLKMVDPAIEEAIDVAVGKIANWVIVAGKREVARLPSGQVVGTTRGKVVAELYKRAVVVGQKTGRLEVKLGMKFVEANIAEEKLTFETTEGHTEVVDFSSARVLDGTGCFSKVRKAVAEHDSSFQVDTFAWKLNFRNLFTAAEPPVCPLDPKNHYILNGSYAAVLKGKRWVFSLSAPDTEEAKWMLEDKATPENLAKLKAFVHEKIPEAEAMLEEEEYTRFFDRRSFTGQVVKVSRLNHGEKIVFLGDSAHAVFPATGEGMNSALEDIGVLVKTLAETAAAAPGETETESQTCQKGWFERYNEVRLADANAISDYAKYTVEGTICGQAEKSRRVATMVVELIGQKTGICGPTWNAKSFGMLSVNMEPYSKLLADWKRQMKYIRPVASAIVFIPNLFAKS